MARLEEITAGATVTGLAGDAPVTVVAVQWHGTDALEVTFKDDRGRLDSGIVYRNDEAAVRVPERGLPWKFDADGDVLRLVSEAYRIRLAHLFDPYLAVHTSSVEPLPHQISAVYQEMLPRLPLRYVLADDPGSGKTIMAGLLIRELIVRGDLRRCLIVSPGSLAEQWQDEMRDKFHLRFDILTNDRIETAAGGNVFAEMNFCIARLDKLSRSETLKEKLRASEWDLIIADEAHKMSATIWGGKVKPTKRFLLGRLLSSITRNFLLLTATPHNGKETEFQLFMSLVDPDRFRGAVRASGRPVDVSDVMRRLVKENLLRFDGTPLFPERLAYTVNYDLSESEEQLYRSVTQYVRDEFNRADQLNSERKNTVGFALTILQRRLASSPEAIYQSLRRRRERLMGRLDEERLVWREADCACADFFEEDYDEDDLPPSEREAAEERVADEATASQTIDELRAEIETLGRLERMADEVRQSGVDRKWEELSRLLQDDERMFGGGRREKLIIFTEHLDTLRYLAGKIGSLLGNANAVAVIHGGILREDRRAVEEQFKQDPEVRILIATDAAGEGINLQRAHLMVNYDLPWNPNRIEQRFGRIHRIGQTEVCHLWNLVAVNTREGMVFDRLLQKLEKEREALHGQVFDVLGKVSFDNRPLKDLIIEAVRYGDDPAVRERLFRTVDNALDTGALENLLNQRALTEDAMDFSRVAAIREEMERVEAHKLQPHFIESFFLTAFRDLDGTAHPQPGGRYKITHVPSCLRARAGRTAGFGGPVLDRYERVCFDKERVNVHGLPPAAFLCPGHPLLDAVIDLVLEHHGGVMKRGAVFIDDSDDSAGARLLFYIEDAVQDGTRLPGGGRRVVSREVHFIEIAQDGSARGAGYAPYLDYRAATREEGDAVREYAAAQEWLSRDVEKRACDYAVSEIIPRHLERVRRRRLEMAEKIERAVRERLTGEIQYWDLQAAELRRREREGRADRRISSQKAADRAESLAARLEKRLGEIRDSKKISPAAPVVVGGALVVPRGLLRTIAGGAPEPPPDAAARRAVELAAMRAVMEIERSLGHTPRDVSAENIGYDVESKIPPGRGGGPGGPLLRFIEVKGRAKGATSVTVSKNEIMAALNRPEEFILALVEVDGPAARTVYLKRPFHNLPDFSAKNVTFDIARLTGGAEVVFPREDRTEHEKEAD